MSLISVAEDNGISVFWDQLETAFCSGLVFSRFCFYTSLDLPLVLKSCFLSFSPIRGLWFLLL